MQYAKISLKDNKSIEYCPRNYKMPDGKIVINFNKNIPLLKKCGYKELRYSESPALKDGYILVPSYEDKGDYIEQSWIYEEDNSVIVESFEERVLNLEQENKMLKECILEISEVLYA